MLPCLVFISFLNVLTIVLSKYEPILISENAITTKTFAIWRNATVPFYVNPAHFDHEQTLAILSTLSMFAFKTCIKFKPVMARPYPTDEVMVFINPEGTKRCEFAPRGHSVFNPHFVKLGYECLKSPEIDMMVMRALGFPFEHNRDSRDLYIEVLNENIEPGNAELFTKEDFLPLELKFLPYDLNSVMHFGNRDFSKNGHRTIIFKDSNAKQNRIGLTETDMKKIEIVYGPECRARDRQEKIELCQSYPGVARRKRDAEDDTNALGETEPTLEPVDRKQRNIYLDDMVTKSLRVNPDITAPPAVNKTEDITKTLKELGIDEAVDDIVDQVYKVSSLALKNARAKYCNKTSVNSDDAKIGREGEDHARNSSDVLGIIEHVADFAKGMVDHAIQNLTKFCENSGALESYQRYSCDLGFRDPRCRNTYRSTKSGAIHYSTKHRPILVQYTKHVGGRKPQSFARQGNATDEKEPTNPTARKKRDLKPDNQNEQPKTADQNNPAEESLSKASEADMKVVAKKNATGDSEKAKANEDSKEKSDKDKTAEHKEKAVEDDKNKAIKADTDNIKAKPEEELTVNEKPNLRSRTRVPIDRSRKNRRAYGDDSEHSDTFPEDRDNLDTLIAKKIIEEKHIIQKNHRKEKRGQIHFKDADVDVELMPSKVEGKKRTHKKLEHISVPIEAFIKNDESEVSREKYIDQGISEEVNNDKETDEDQQIREIVVQKKIQPYDSLSDEDVMEESDVDERTTKRPKQKKRPKLEKHKSLPRTVVLSKKNRDFYDERRWPNGELVYMIQVDNSYDLTDMRRRLAEVRDILREKTCVKLKEIKPGEVHKYDDYIVIDSSPDYVTGRVGGKQKFGSIELFRGGQHRQHAAMMVMAMLGFYFEVSRHDRAKYIRVHMRHVRPDKLHHFELIRSDATLPLPYDYASATHPAWQFWRQMGRTGISTVATFKEHDPSGAIMNSLGQNEKVLSDIDIMKINSVYGIDCFKRMRAKAGNPGRNNTTLPKPAVRN